MEQEGRIFKTGIQQIDWLRSVAGVLPGLLIRHAKQNRESVGKDCVSIQHLSLGVNR